jgi:hypothetical protein
VFSIARFVTDVPAWRIGPTMTAVALSVFELAGHENSVFDACADAVPYMSDALLAKIISLGGSESKVRNEFREFFSFSM